MFSIINTKIFLIYLISFIFIPFLIKLLIIIILIFIINKSENLKYLPNKQNYSY